MGTREWYAQLVKPSWAPPAWLFGPVWAVLYVLMAIGFGTIAWAVLQRRISGFIILPLALNVLSNIAFSVLQFEWKSNFWAMIDIFVVLFSLGWFLWLCWRLPSRYRWVFWSQVPYLVWVLFATVLQITMTAWNA